MSEASKPTSVLYPVGAFALAVALTYGFAVFAFESHYWVKGDIAPWVDGLLTATFFLGFGLVALAWVLTFVVLVRWRV